MALAAYGVAAAVLFGPWAVRDREVVEGTPAHPPLYQRVPVGLTRGSPLCVRPVTLTRRTERIRFGTLGERAGVIAVTARGPGYSSTGTVNAAGLVVEAAVTPPRRDLEGEVCFANRSAQPMELLGTNDARVLGRADPVSGGMRHKTFEVAVTLLRREPESLAARVDDAFARAGVVGAGFLAPWVLWLLLPLVVLGIPLGALGALAAAAQPEDREQERREEDLQADDQ